MEVLERLGARKTLFSGVEGADVTVHNYEQCSEYVDEALDVLGIQPIKATEASTSPDACIRVVNGVHKLIQKLKSSILETDDLRDRMLRFKDDVTHFRATQDRLTNELDEARKERAVLKEENRQLILSLQEANEKLSSSKAEVKKTKIDTQRLVSQSEHSKKKIERETVRLKERLQKLLQEKNNERRIGMQLVNALQRKTGKRGQWANADKAQDDFNHVIIANYEEKQKELLTENEELRNSLTELQNELVSVLNRDNKFGEIFDPRQGEESGFGKEKVNSLKSISRVEVERDYTRSESPMHPGQFQMPYASAQPRIEETLKSKLKALKTMLTRLESGARPDSNSATLETLQKQIDEYREVIERQQQALLEAGPDNGSRQGLDDSALYSQQEELRIEKEMLKKKLANFEAERAQFTDRAIKMEERLATAHQQKLNERSPLYKLDTRAQDSPADFRTHDAREFMLSSVLRQPKPSTPKANNEEVLFADDLAKYLSLADP
eukprot:m.83970 g.83970  ORF g.83970 m.83970 type:complete len:497 (-) comp12947_c0_seq1:203-1693(-)